MRSKKYHCLLADICSNNFICCNIRIAPTRRASLIIEMNRILWTGVNTRETTLTVVSELNITTHCNIASWTYPSADSAFAAVIVNYNRPCCPSICHMSCVWFCEVGYNLTKG